MFEQVCGEKQEPASERCAVSCGVDTNSQQPAVKAIKLNSLKLKGSG
jgi:hypothetical protein